MNAPAFENLDLACAKKGYEIAKEPPKDLGNVIMAALAVLEEQGLYALFLYLKARGGEEGKKVSNELETFLKSTPTHNKILRREGDIFTRLQNLATDLDKLLLARDLVRQVLVYARYHAKLKEESGANS